ncbi:MAG: beta-ketoacyl synthase chain length factor [Rubrivivax sp.]|nr:beta-ketoacyl synthase chain length factor [Rubrivivax sp.]
MSTQGTLTVHVAGIGALGPGLPDWAAARACLLAPGTWQRQATVVPQSDLLPPTERRRAGSVVKASIAVADAACRHAGVDPASMATVFASSSGEPANCHALCEALATAERLVSPTRFTNSVHNAAAGYWHIATHSMQASTSLCGFDASFAAGLLEAAAQCQSGQRPVLLVACDSPYPEPLNALRHVADVFAVALLLQPVGGGGGGCSALQLRLQGAAPDTACDDARFEELRRTIPAARSLPLMQALARQAPVTMVLEGPPGLSLRLDVAPARGTPP